MNLSPGSAIKSAEMVIRSAKRQFSFDATVAGAQMVRS